MHIAHDIAFIQARIQARHGARLSESDWQGLRNNRSLSLYLDSANATELKIWTKPLHANMKPHTIERLLRAAWRDYIIEVSHWSAQKWRPGLHWLSYLPDLPVINHILHGGPAPEWLSRDPHLASLMLHYPSTAKTSSKDSGLASLLDMADPAISTPMRWRKHFKKIWPADERHSLAVLEKSLDAIFKKFDPNSRNDKFANTLATLERETNLFFRRRALTPLVVFAHLGLVAIDMLRLRSDLLQRCLFAEIPPGGP